MPIFMRDLTEDLGVPSDALLADLYRAEHTLFTGNCQAFDDNGDPFVLHGVGTGTTEQCAVWPTDADIEAHRRLTVERIVRVDIDPNRKAP